MRLSLLSSLWLAVLVWGTAGSETGSGRETRERVKTSVSVSTSVSTSSRIRRLKSRPETVTKVKNRSVSDTSEASNEKASEVEEEAESDSSISLVGRGFRPSVRREAIRRKLQQAKTKAKFVPVKPVRQRAQFRPTSLPASTTTPVSLLELNDSSGAALQEEERRLEEKLVKLAILEEELEHLEQVNRIPKQIKEQDQKTRKSRKRLKKRRRKPIDQGLSALAPLSNGLGRSVEEKGRNRDQGGRDLEGQRFSSVFIQPVATITPLVLPTPLPPSPLPLPSQPIRIPSPRLHSPSVTSPLLPSSVPLTTSIPIFRSPIQFAAPASSHPNLPVSRTPTASLPSLPPQPISHPFLASRSLPSSSPLNSLNPQPFTPPFPAPHPFPSTSSFPRFHLPQFFSIPFPEMRQGRSSPTEGGLFNAIGLPRANSADGFHLGPGAYSFAIPAF